MKGTLRKTQDGWKIEFNAKEENSSSLTIETLPLHPDDVNLETVNFINNNYSFEDRVVEFEIKYYWQEGMEQPEEVAKLISEEIEYPELEGLINLCQDIIEARANESVLPPYQLEPELLSVRAKKKQHVREQRYTLASIYREAEKEIQSLITNQSQKPESESTCSNCQMLLSAIGVGQGLICDLNKCRIPHSKHSCQYHFKTVTKSA